MMSLMLHAHYYFHATFRLLAKHLEPFSLEIQISKSITTFEQHADDVTFGGPILPKILEIKRN